MLFFQATAVIGLLSSTALAGALISKRSVCQAGVQMINGEQFTIQCGVDRAGNNLDDGVQTTFNGCGALCDSNPFCVTAEYSETNGFCYQKSSQNQLSLVNAVDTFDKGSGCTSNINSQTCTVQCGMDSPGNNIDAGSYTGSYAACAALCAVNPQCATAQYKLTNGFCYQKTAINGNGFSADATVVSLVCPSTASN